MNYVPAIAPISDMRVRAGEIVAAAQQGPVIMLEKGSRPALVVISPERGNALMERLEHDHHLDGRTVRIGYDFFRRSVRPENLFRIDLGHDKGNIRFHAERR